MQVENEKLYTVSDVARLTGAAPRKIRKMLKGKNAKGTKAGGRRLFSAHEINAAFCDEKALLRAADGSWRDVRGFIDESGAGAAGGLRVCVVADMYGASREEARLAAERISEIIEKGGFEKSGGRQSFSYEYLENEKKARFSIIGGYRFALEALKGLDMQTGGNV